MNWKDKENMIARRQGTGISMQALFNYETKNHPVLNIT